jgi:beta-glucanase (GH16 family)
LAKLIQGIITVLFIIGIVLVWVSSTGRAPVANWSDTFQGPAGSPPDPESWSSVVNGAGGGNSELEYYVPEANALAGSGGLVITAARDNGRFPAWYGPSQYTSGKLWTAGKVNFKYGHIQVTAALPNAGQPGSWPAIWMLGADYPNVGWPNCGEIDIMENFGSLGKNNEFSSSIHTPSTSLTQAYTFPAGVNMTTMHTYAIDWRPQSITFSVDGTPFFTVTQSEVPTWPFNQPFFLILNLAIGGTQGGTVPATAELPYTMDVQSAEAFNSHVSK